MDDVRECWTLVRTDAHLRTGYVRLDDLKLPDQATAEGRRDDITKAWTKPHGQDFEIQCYRPGTLRETLEAKGLELILV